LFRRVQDADETLSNPDRRAAYDRQLLSPGGLRRSELVGLDVDDAECAP
jgi:curved DNA-binding protein CbpA